MTETTETPTARDHDSAVAELCRMLINSVVKDSESIYGDTARERLVNHVKSRTDERMMQALDAFSAYRSAQAQERQAAAMESIAKTASRIQMTESIDTTAQAIVDEREPKREYLASTYSLPPKTLMLLWSMRGMLVDASIKSLSRPDRFDPYRKVSTEDIAWTLRFAPEGLLKILPRKDDDSIDFDLMEEFGIVHYDGTPEQPDGWMFAG
jgi:hypothetical protein